MGKLITYPVAILASVVVLAFAAVIVVCVLSGTPVGAVLGAVGAFVAAVGGVFAHRAVTPLARPRDRSGHKLTRNN